MSIISSSYQSTSPIYPSQLAFKLPTKQEANEVFWGLGDRFWMQMIDGKFHQYGPMVFDEGLHGGQKEPGFFASLKSGCEFAAEHLTENLSVAFYKELHQKLCVHFKGDENNVLMTSTETGRFRDKPADHTFSDLSFLKILPEKECQDILDKAAIALESIIKSQEHREKALNLLWKECKKKVLDLNMDIFAFSNKFQIPAFAQISAWPDTGVKIEYRCTSPEHHEKIVEYLFDDYQQKIGGLNLKLNNTSLESEINRLKREKIKVIADLFQKLEWLHPFEDGQGRTDLVFQAKILAEQGFNPAILQEPYMSTYSPLAEWEEYLFQGTERWKAEKSK